MFTHHETIEARTATERSGRFEIVETNEGYLIYEDGYKHAECDTLRKAINKAKKLADKFDKENQK